MNTIHSLIKKYEQKATTLESTIKQQELVLWQNKQKAKIWREVVADLKNTQVVTITVGRFSDEKKK